MSVASTNQVWALRGLKDYQRVTLMAFADWADATGNGWFTIATLMAKLDKDESTARRHRDWAISKGHLTIVKQVKGRGGKTYYKLTLKGDSSDPQKGVTSSEKGGTAMTPFSDQEAPQQASQKGVTFDEKGVTFEQNPSHALREPNKQPIGIGGNTPPSQPSASAREPLAEKAPINGEAEALLLAAEVSKPKAARLAAAYALEKIRLQVEQYRADLATGADIGPGALAWRIENDYTPPVKAEAAKRNYNPDVYLAAEHKQDRTQGRYSWSATGVRADEYRRHEEASAAAPPSKENQVIDLQLEKGVDGAAPAVGHQHLSPGKHLSPDALEVVGHVDQHVLEAPSKENKHADQHVFQAPAQGDDLQSAWARLQYDFVQQNPQAADWLQGSVLESTNELEEGKPVFNIVVADRKQVDWLNTHVFAIRRSLSVEMRRAVVVKVVTLPGIPLDAFTRKMAVTA